MKYKKKPVEIEAIQWNGNLSELSSWLTVVNARRHCKVNNDNTLTIETLEGNHLALIGDFIICGVKGEIYPCKPDIFELTYDRINITEEV